MLKNKFIISLIGIYVFLLFALPPFITNGVKVVCKNYSHNSNYEIQIKNPQVKFSLLPIGTFKAEELILRAKNNSAQANIQNFETKLRLLPLLSGRIHINSLSLGKIKLSATLVKDLELDKDFFKKLESTPLKLNSLNIGEFEALLYQKDVKTPITYNGKGHVYERKNR